MDSRFSSKHTPKMECGHNTAQLKEHFGALPAHSVFAPEPSQRPDHRSAMTDPTDDLLGQVSPTPCSTAAATAIATATATAAAVPSPTLPSPHSPPYATTTTTTTTTTATTTTQHSARVANVPPTILEFIER